MSDTDDSEMPTLASDTDSDSDDDLEDLDGLRSELKALQDANSDCQAKLDYYEKNKVMILEKNRMKRKQLKDRLEELEQQVLQQ